MKKYKVIYADPPWRFKNFSEKGEGRNAISHYDCLTLADLKKLVDMQIKIVHFLCG